MRINTPIMRAITNTRMKEKPEEKKTRFKNHV